MLLCKNYKVSLVIMIAANLRAINSITKISNAIDSKNDMTAKTNGHNYAFSNFSTDSD